MRDALLIIDVVNPLDFEGAEKLLQPMLRLIDPLRTLVGSARESGVPILWVNDGFDGWTSSFDVLLERCEQGPLGPLLREVRPAPDDALVLKPRHSGFYQTPLPHLLGHLGAERLVLVGVQAHICVLFTAHDAHMRGFDVVVPRDGVASERPEDVEAMLHIVSRVMDAPAPQCADHRWQ